MQQISLPAAGGNVLLILGAKWRVHYYAHLKDRQIKSFRYAERGRSIATVGTSGNAAGKAPHLHYSIVTLTRFLEFI